MPTPTGRSGCFLLCFLLFCSLFTLSRCTFSRIFLLVIFLFSFLILSHDFHEALFLTTRTYLSCTIHTECVEIRNGKTKQFRLLLACPFSPFLPQLFFVHRLFACFPCTYSCSCSYAPHVNHKLEVPEQSDTNHVM